MLQYAQGKKKKTNKKKDKNMIQARTGLWILEFTKNEKLLTIICHKLHVKIFQLLLCLIRSLILQMKICGEPARGHLV